MIAAGFLGIEHFNPPWDIFFLPLFNLLIGLYELPFVDFAIAIILFTVIIRIALAPLFVRQIQSQSEMQRMQPLVREIQRKHKGNRQKITEETMALYKEHGVNQFGGCLPVLLQLPLLFALYQALIRASNVVTLTAEQASSAAFAQLQQNLPGITPIAGQPDKFNAPISGPCNLPAYNISEFSHFLPLNCQLIDPIKLSEPVQTTIPWLFGLNLAAVDQCLRGRDRRLRHLGAGDDRGRPAVRAGQDDEPQAEPGRPDLGHDQHDGLPVPADDDLLGRPLPERPDPLLDRLHRLPGGAAVHDHGLGQPLPHLRLVTTLGAADRSRATAPVKKSTAANENNGPPDDRQLETNSPASASASGDNRQRQRPGQRRRRGRRR